MTQEDKQLLLRDLSARLPYGVICQVDDGAAGLNDGKLVEIDISKELARFDADYYWDAYIDDVKPYLRPMSSMTEEEKVQLSQYACIGEDLNGEFIDEVQRKDCAAYIDWLNKNHFDYPRQVSSNSNYQLCSLKILGRHLGQFYLVIHDQTIVAHSLCPPLCV